MNTRQKKKKRRQFNKWLMERYPFIRGYADFTDYNLIPRGWRKAFGLDLLENIREILIKYAIPLNTLHFADIKEKYGELRMYADFDFDFDASHEAWKEINDTIDDYSVVSRNVCICCGRPDSGITKGYWIEPICESCWNCHSPYDESVTLGKIPDTYTIKHYSSEKGDWNEERNIKDKADKIRARWRKK